MMKNAFYFNLKVLFFLKKKTRLDYKDKVNFKIYDVTAWLTRYYNSHITKYIRKRKQPVNEIWSVNRI